MVDIFKKIVDEGIKNWKLVLVVGLHEMDMPKLKKLQLKGKGYPIEFLRNANKDKLSKIYSKSKIYWHASGYGEDLERNPELAEHFGISTVEAMASGAVPIVINAGGQKEIVENNKNGFLWNSLEELVQKTVTLIKNSELLDKMSKEAVKKSIIFGKDRFCNELMNIVK